MDVYVVVLFIHIIGAVMGLGAAFSFPIIAKSAKTVTQAKYTLQLLKKLEIMPKVGSITLLITGLVMGILETALFSQFWFIASIVVYLGTQIVVIGFLPKTMKAQIDLLEQTSGEDLPSEYAVIGRKSSRLEGIAHASAFVLILLMVFQPTF
ncbi:DUF2269 family protein [Paenibacillus sp. 2TAB19]|uniref:DUF2269 family protein n=1 Tax=Paenibacillus sp. 2TAB19 TaxID=3233003 RepID=UPI003F9DFCBB